MVQCVCSLMPSWNTYCLTWVSLTLNVGISSWLHQQSAAAAPYLGRGVSPQQPIVDHRSSKVIQDFYLYDPSFHSSLGSNTFASEIPTLIIQSNKLSILLHSNTGKTLSYKN